MDVLNSFAQLKLEDENEEQQSGYTPMMDD
jgi:hypothetical protein